MSTRLHVPALAMSLALAAIAPWPALAKSLTTSHQAYASAHQSPPPGANAAAAIPLNSVRQTGRPFETDPDPRIRFEMNRDDRDRRLGGSSSGIDKEPLLNFGLLSFAKGAARRT
jgi:hypothetical protein